jgi:uncharacterized membrane protein YfcA
MTQTLLAVSFGLAIGLSLGLIGGGGAILAVPVLVFVLDENVKQATTTSLMIVGAAALVGAIDHGRRGRVRARLAVALSAGGAVGAVAGTGLNRLVSADTILFLFAFVLLAAAYGMLRRNDKPESEKRDRPTEEAWLRALPAGVGVGLLTGFFGVGGGFLIVPLLVLVFGFNMKTAVGTSLLVITLTSAAALTAHLATGTVDWAVAGPFTAGGVAGALVGSRVSAHVPARRLQEAFALLVITLAAVLLARDATAIL